MFSELEVTSLSCRCEGSHALFAIPGLWMQHWALTGPVVNRNGVASSTIFVVGPDGDFVVSVLLQARQDGCGHISSQGELQEERRGVSPSARHPQVGSCHPGARPTDCP